MRIILSIATIALISAALWDAAHREHQPSPLETAVDDLRAQVARLGEKMQAEQGKESLAAEVASLNQTSQAALDAEKKLEERIDKLTARVTQAEVLASAKDVCPNVTQLEQRVKAAEQWIELEKFIQHFKAGEKLKEWASDYLKAHPELPPEEVSQVKELIKNGLDAKGMAKPPKVPANKMEAAKEQAAATGRQAVYVLTRPDSCPACRRFEANVLASPFFQTYADKYFVVCELDVNKDDVSAFTIDSVPAVLVFNPTTGKYRKAFTPAPSVDSFLSQLGR